ncbi:PREDICTED: arginine/serine-rich protein 1 [Poecilia mexicana]|uniref:arginine/serine-rich protein 1 n=1 Tax=Poecilia mexicana TaxID=48701 RepID=UPI00072EEC4A|nr:PREDICTED: arginine/serine-rich protein 1 [Poecilia mexicana]
MATQVDSHSDMAQARQSDGINVIFDQKSPGSSHSRSRSRSVSSSASSRSTGSDYRGRKSRRGRSRSSSSSSSSSCRSGSSSSSRSRSRSRSYPRCYRHSSRCRCDNHRSYGGYRRPPPRRYRAHSRSFSRSPPRRYRGRSRSYSRSPPRHYRARSRSYTRSPVSDRYSRHRRSYRSRSRSWSPARWSRYRRPASQLRCRFSRSPSMPYRGRSRSRSSGHSVSLSLRDKRELLEVAKANAMRMLGVEKLDLPESVKPILSEQPAARSSSPEPVTGMRHGSQKTNLEDESEPGVSSPRMESRKIAFSVNNSVAKPTVVAPSPAKVTPRVDSVESRKPYGHWIPISAGQNSSPNKHR